MANYKTSKRRSKKTGKRAKYRRGGKGPFRDISSKPYSREPKEGESLFPSSGKEESVL